MVKALVRGLASSFEHAIKMAPSAEPIIMGQAYKQQEQYVSLLKSLVDQVIELPADNKHPDCCFIEDTAVVVGKSAIIAHIGAAARQGEEAPVADALQGLGFTLSHLKPPATLDGGDVLQLPGSSAILVGLSKRTNQAAVQQMQQFLPSHQVHGVQVAAGLHLKSAVTALDAATLLFSDNVAGRGLSQLLQSLPFMNLPGHEWQHVFVPDPVAANVLLLGKHVVMQEGCQESEQLLQGMCEQRGLVLHKLPRMTEFIKVDGALTCCSILLPS